MSEILYDSVYFVNGEPRSIETGEPMREVTRDALPLPPKDMTYGIDTDLFRPEEQLSADPELMKMVFDTLSNHLFESWTDADLYRAIDAPENGPGERQDEEIAEYVGELKKRKAAREALAARSAELREKYQI